MTYTMQFHFIPLIFLLIIQSIPFAGGCSSRSTPKPRPTVSTPRPNITFHTYSCPPNYNAWYCLNGATCFTLKIGESILYNCECAEGFMGQRCEFKDLDGSYLPARHRVLLETASIASGATVAVFLVVIICIFVYTRYQRKNKLNFSESVVDGVDLERIVPFAKRNSNTNIPLRHLVSSHPMIHERPNLSLSRLIPPMRTPPGSRISGGRGDMATSITASLYCAGPSPGHPVIQPP